MTRTQRRLTSKRSRRQARTETEQALRLIPPKPREEGAIRPLPGLTVVRPVSRANRLATQLRR